MHRSPEKWLKEMRRLQCKNSRMQIYLQHTNQKNCLQNFLHQDHDTTYQSSICMNRISPALTPRIIISVWSFTIFTPQIAIIIKTKSIIAMKCFKNSTVSRRSVRSTNHIAKLYDLSLPSLRIIKPALLRRMLIAS